MKTFIGVKLINAKPMTRAEYNVFRGWELPADENGDDEGYLVEYVDGGKANTAEYAGYVSWSPKDVFERAYVEVGDVSTMPPHQQRVLAEKAELDGRAGKLAAFFDSQIFSRLDCAERDRLRKQHELMSGYSAVLGERIAAFQ